MNVKTEVSEWISTPSPLYGNILEEYNIYNSTEKNLSIHLIYLYELSENVVHLRLKRNNLTINSKSP